MEIIAIQPLVALVAASVGNIRLIDNLLLNATSETA